MEEDVKATLSDLCRAIDDVLSSSPRVNESLRKLESLGFQFSVYMEATLLLSRKDDKKASRRGPRGARRVRSGPLQLSEKDLKFLASLNIRLDEKSH